MTTARMNAGLKMIEVPATRTHWQTGEQERITVSADVQPGYDGKPWLCLYGGSGIGLKTRPLTQLTIQAMIADGWHASARNIRQHDLVVYAGDLLQAFRELDVDCPLCSCDDSSCPHCNGWDLPVGDEPPLVTRGCICKTGEQAAYCHQCDVDTHVCPGCGKPIPHGSHACQDCDRA